MKKRKGIAVVSGAALCGTLSAERMRDNSHRCSCGAVNCACPLHTCLHACLLPPHAGAPAPTGTSTRPLLQKHKTTAVAGVSGKRTKKHQRKVGAVGCVAGDLLQIYKACRSTLLSTTCRMQGHSSIARR